LGDGEEGKVASAFQMMHRFLKALFAVNATIHHAFLVSGSRWNR